MKVPFNRRSLSALVVAFVAAASGTIVYAGIPDSSNVYHGCLLIGVGTIRLIDPSLPASNVLSHCISGKETAITWNQQGPQGLPGIPGINGKDGTSVLSSVLAVGDSHCANGGVQLQSASGLTYVCNGKDGVNGTNGKDGAPGTTLTSIDQLNGIGCTIHGAPGTISVSQASDGSVTIVCVPAPDTTPRCSAADTPSAIKINEVQIFSDSPSSNFVELVNTCSGSVDLSGWTLVYRDANNNITDPSFPAGMFPDTVFATLGPLLHARVFLGIGGSGCPQCRAPGGGILDTGGGAIGLRMPNGQLVDSLAYGTLNVPNSLGEGAPAAIVISHLGYFLTIGRFPDGADTNDNAADFGIMSIPTPAGPNSGLLP